MSVHTFRQRTALQRAQQRWPRSHNHLRLVQVAPSKPNWLERLAEAMWRLHDQRWPWIIAAMLIAAGDAAILTSTLPWWRS